MGELRTRSARHQGGPVQRGTRLLHRFRSEHLRFRLEPHGPGHETRKAQNLKVGIIDRQYGKVDFGNAALRELGVKTSSCPQKSSRCVEARIAFSPSPRRTVTFSVSAEVLTNHRAS